MSIRAHHHLSEDCLDLRSANNGCPFCHKTFLKLGCHLPWCKERKGQDKSCYLSQKTLAKRNKAGKKMCPQCGRKFARLDTHLKGSSTCTIIPTPMSPVVRLSSSIQVGMISSRIQQQSIDTPETVNSHHPISQGVCLSSKQTASYSTRYSHQSKSLQHKSPLQLSLTKDEWLAADVKLSTSVVPAVLSCDTVDEKNRTLCDGVYQNFSQQFGTKKRKQGKRPRQSKEQMKRLEELI